MKLFAFLLLMTALTAHAQQVRKITCVEGLPSTEADYKRWLDRDAKYIITQPEKDAFLKLSTNDERERFVENFWLRRDPTPGTESNEYRDEYYTRIAYANERFRSGIAGWQTDRGKVYIMRGPPARVESGLTLDIYRNNVPYEKWYYGDGSALTFVDPTSSDEYRMLTPEDRKSYPHIWASRSFWKRNFTVRHRGFILRGDQAYQSISLLA